MWWWQLELQDVQSSSQVVTNNIPTPDFLQAGCPSCCPTNNVEAPKGNCDKIEQMLFWGRLYCDAADWQTGPGRKMTPRGTQRHLLRSAVTSLDWRHSNLPYRIIGWMRDYALRPAAWTDYNYGMFLITIRSGFRRLYFRCCLFTKQGSGQLPVAWTLLRPLVMLNAIIEE